MTIARGTMTQENRLMSDVLPCRNVVYLDNQASTRPDPRVVEAMLPWLGVAANPHAVEHETGRTANAAIEQAREQVAALLECMPSEITFTSGATEATNTVLRGLLMPGDRLVVSAIEHPSVMATARALASDGVEVVTVGVTSDGHLDLDDLEGALVSGPTLASIMQVNNEIGTVQPVADVAALCAASETALHCDMTQGAGRISSPLSAGEVSYASLSAHKIYGPQGIGALFVRSGSRRPRALLQGGGQERGLRSGTLPVAACVGFGKACELALLQREDDAQHALALQRAVLAVLSSLDGWHVNGSLEMRVPHNLSVTFAAVEAEALLAMLPGFALSTGSACSGGAPGSSPTLQAIGLDRCAIAATIRIGFGRDTTREQAVEAAQAISVAVERLREVAR